MYIACFRPTPAHERNAVGDARRRLHQFADLAAAAEHHGALIRRRRVHHAPVERGRTQEGLVELQLREDGRAREAHKFERGPRGAGGGRHGCAV